MHVCITIQEMVVFMENFTYVLNEWFPKIEFNWIKSIEFMLIKFQMGTPSHIELTSKSLISIWWHKLWKYFIFLFHGDIFKLYFIEQANEKGPRFINRSISNEHWLLLLLYAEQF